jgi:hypothetical protein
VANWLLLEGYTDRELFSFFAQEWSLSYDCNPKNDNGKAINGVSDLIENHLPASISRLKDGNINRLGIFVDSDNNPNIRKQEIEVQLNKFGLVNPISIGSGWIYDHCTLSGFRVGVLMLPSVTQTGELEDVLASAISTTARPHFNHCDNLVSELQTQQLRQSQKEAKAKIYTLLSTQNKPSANFSYLGSDKLIDINHSSIQGIKTWLEEIYK